MKNNFCSLSWYQIYNGGQQFIVFLNVNPINVAEINSVLDKNNFSIEDIKLIFLDPHDLFIINYIFLKNNLFFVCNSKKDIYQVLRQIQYYLFSLCSINKFQKNISNSKANFDEQLFLNNLAARLNLILKNYFDEQLTLNISGDGSFMIRILLLLNILNRLL
jgi:hypothetical protein